MQIVVTVIWQISDLVTVIAADVIVTVKELQTGKAFRDSGQCLEIENLRIL